MTYRPGSFFLTSIAGPAGFAIGVAQAVAGSPSRFEHAGIIVDVTGTTVEAEPGGARFGHIADYAGHALLISDAPVQRWLAGNDGVEGCASCQFGLHDACAGIHVHGPAWKDCQCRCDMDPVIRNDIVREAYGFVGIGYSALDYLALALLHLEQLLTGRKDSRWRVTAIVRRRVEKSGHVICSQLVDAVYERAGIHLFAGRLPGDVTPADLAAWAEDQEATQ